MTYRITRRMIEDIVVRINDALRVPQELYAKDRNEHGDLVPNAGTVYLAGAYGGWRLEQMCEGGGSRDFLDSGYIKKRNLYDAAHEWLHEYRLEQLAEEYTGKIPEDKFLRFCKEAGFLEE